MALPEKTNLTATNRSLIAVLSPNIGSFDPLANNVNLRGLIFMRQVSAPKAYSAPLLCKEWSCRDFQTLRRSGFPEKLGSQTLIQ